MNTTSKKTLTILSSSALAAGFAQGAIVYQNCNRTIGSANNQSITFDLNQDGFADFSVAFYESGLQMPPYINPSQKPFLVAENNSSSLTNSVLANSPVLNPSGLPVTPAGTTIDGGYESAQTTGFFYYNFSGTQVGDWSSAGDIDGYVGLELTDASNNTYFGWAHFIYNQSADLGGSPGTLTLVDAAFETQPGVGILAGQTAEAGSAPVIVIPPVSGTNYLGGTAQLRVVSTGDTPLSYQWSVGLAGAYTNLADGGNIVGATSNVLTINNFSAANAADYVVKVTNVNGSATTAVPATLSAAPLLVSPLYPSPIKLYAGGHVIINATNYSSVPVQFQWRKNGVNLTDGGNVSGAATASLTLSPVAATDAANYSLVLANSFGSVTSGVDPLTVTAPASAYAQALFSLHPQAYWPLSETAGTVAYDVAGGHNGTYLGGVVLGQPGVTNANFGASSYAAQFGGTNYVDVPDSAAFNLSNAVTAVVWVNVPAAPNQTMGLFSHGGNSWNLNLKDIPFAFQASGEGTDAFGNGTPPVATSTSPVATNNWHMVAFTYTGVPSTTVTNGFLYVDGVQVGTQLLKYAPLPAATAQNWTNVDVWIGGGPDQGVRPGRANNQLFTGSLANAALFTNALSGAQIQALYALAYEPIHVSLQTIPGDTNVVVSWPVGTLLQSPSLTGPWTTNSAMSPYTNPPTAPQLFFKVVVPSL